VGPAADAILTARRCHSHRFPSIKLHGFSSKALGTSAWQAAATGPHTRDAHSARSIGILHPTIQVVGYRLSFHSVGETRYNQARIRRHHNDQPLSVQPGHNCPINHPHAAAPRTRHKALLQDTGAQTKGGMWLTLRRIARGLPSQRNSRSGDKLRRRFSINWRALWRIRNT